MDRQPRELVAAIEADPRLPTGDDERFAGYGVMGLPFASGHYLGLRRFPAASIGTGYTSVWHRDPAGQWTMTADTAPDQQCARYFGTSLADAPQAPIHIDWTGPRAFTVTIDGRLEWSLVLGRTPATSLMTAVGSALPDALWRNDAVLGLMGRVAGPMLRVGRVALQGAVPNQQGFQANPRRLWTIASSTAVVDGVDVGSPGPLATQAKLGDFWLPQRGVFAIGETYMDTFDATKHLTATTGAAPRRAVGD